MIAIRNVRFLILAAALCATAPAAAQAPVRSVNVLTVPFTGVVPGPDESIALTGSVLVKTVHYPNNPEKPITTKYKVDRASGGVGMTSGRPYSTIGSTSAKFRYVFPTAAPMRGIDSGIKYCICCGPLNEIPCTKVCCNNVQVTLDFTSAGEVQPGESGASAQAPLAAGSCGTVVQVCD
jgi:hypothetical protein